MIKTEEPPKRATIPRDGDRILCIGSSGSGKTTLAVRSLVRDVRRFGRHALVFDPTGDVYKYVTEGSALGTGRDATIPREWIVKVTSEDQLTDAIRSSPTNWFKGRDVRVVVVSPGHGGMDYESAMRLWEQLANAPAREGWVLFADEAHFIFSLSLSTKSKAMLIAGQCRNRRTRLYACSNFPQQLSPILRQNSEHVCAFLANNRQFVSDGCHWFGDSEWFEPCLELEQFEYVYRRPGARPTDPEPVVDLHAIEDEIPWV